jgi:hypothetical protein
MNEKKIVASTVALFFTAVLMLAFIIISSDEKQALIKRIINGDLSIGQYCQLSNQCPQNAFCSGTCQCPLHYYFNTTSGKCNKRKTNGVSCTSDYQCYINVGLRCQTTCQCDSTKYWNSSFLVIGGLSLGRCQNRKVFGMTCSSSYEGVPNIAYVISFNSQVLR